VAFICGRWGYQFDGMFSPERVSQMLFAEGAILHKKFSTYL
jgi:hypothetical protein